MDGLHSQDFTIDEIFTMIVKQYQKKNSYQEVASPTRPINISSISFSMEVKLSMLMRSLIV